MRLRSFKIHKTPWTQFDVAGKSSAFFFWISHSMLAVGAVETWTWWPHLANFRLDQIVVFSGNHRFFFLNLVTRGERKRERGGGGGGVVRDWTELTAGVNFAFSSMPNDMHAEERQARLEHELKCKWEESDKAHRSVPTSCLDPLEHVESKLGFSHMSIFSQSAERAARAAPNGVKKGAIFLLVFRCLNHTAFSRKAFNGVQKGQVHSKKHKPSKKIFLLTIDFGVTTRGP